MNSYNRSVATTISTEGFFYWACFMGMLLKVNTKNLWLKFNHLKLQNKREIFISKNLFLFLHLFVAHVTKKR